MLDTIQIEKALKRHRLTAPCFGGVYAYDQTPKRLKHNTAYVINTHPSYLPGEHWFALYVNRNGVIHHFDSAGVKRKLKWTNPIVYNKRRIQGSSPLCGQYVLLFILTSVAPWKFNFNHLDKDIYYNDKIVRNVVWREFGV